MVTTHHKTEGTQSDRAAFGISITRKGCEVNITLNSADEYGSLALFDTIVQSVEDGRLQLNLRALPENSG